MKKKVISLVLGMALIMAWAGIALAQDCDPAFKNIEAYYCKEGKKEFKVGLKTDERTVCVELKQLKIDGCDVEPVATMRTGQYIYFIGPKGAKSKFQSYKFQCDNDAGSYRGGIHGGSFEGHLHPDYTIGKFPGESNSDRARRFMEDLESEGKALYGSVHIFQPVDKFNLKYDKQICQFFNEKTEKIALRFTCTVTLEGAGGASGNKKDDLIKGFKGLFGK
jgi:hypothetical protein